MNPLVITRPFPPDVSDNLFLLVSDHNSHVIDSGHCECLELMIQNRCFVNFNQAFWMFPMDGANPGTLTCSQYYCFHNVSLIVFIVGVARGSRGWAKNLRLK